MPTALTVTRCLLDTLLDQLDQAKQSESGDTTQQEPSAQKETKSSGEIARILSFISFLMNQAPFKAAFLALVQPGYVVITDFPSYCVILLLFMY